MSQPAHWDWAPGDAGRLAVHYRQPGGEPVDLTGTTATAVIETPDGAMPVAAALDAGAGVVTLALPESLTHPARYAITLIYSDGTTAPLLTGAVLRIGGAVGHDWRVPALTGGRLALRYRDASGEPVDLTGVDVAVVVESERDTITPGLDVDPASGRITLTLTADQARDIGAEASYTVTLAWPGGLVADLVTGPVIVETARTADYRLLPDGIRDARAKRLLTLMTPWDDLPIERVKLYDLDAAGGDLLRQFAWQFHVMGEEGWNQAETEAQRRDLVRHAMHLHRHRGTPWAVRRGLEILDMTATITEWFDETQAPPYTFAVTVARDGRGFDSRTLGRIKGMIEAQKNVRSHLNRLTVDTTAPHAGVHYGSGCLAGTVTTLTPPPVRRLSRRVRPRHAAGLLAGTITTLQPMDADG